MSAPKKKGAVLNYPYGDRRITRDEGVALIVESVYPHENRGVARKRVRAAIDYAITSKRIAKANSYVAADFFGWAIIKWPELGSVAGLPANRTVGLSGQQVNTHTGDAVSMPSDPDELRRAYARVESQLRDLQRKNKALEKKLKKCEAEDRQMRKQARAWGRLGGRGKAR
jgi:hypothetical protein